MSIAVALYWPYIDHVPQTANVWGWQRYGCVLPSGGQCGVGSQLGPALIMLVCSPPSVAPSPAARSSGQLLGYYINWLHSLRWSVSRALHHSEPISAHAYTDHYRPIGARLFWFILTYWECAVGRSLTNRNNYVYSNS